MERGRERGECLRNELSVGRKQCNGNVEEESQVWVTCSSHPSSKGELAGDLRVWIIFNNARKHGIFWEMTFAWKVNSSASFVRGQSWCILSLVPQPCGQRMCWFLMQEMFSDHHKDPSLWKGTAKLQSLFPLPPPTEVVFVANIKLTHCWKIFFNGSQGFVGEWSQQEGRRGGGYLEEPRQLNAVSLLAAIWGMGIMEEQWHKEKKMLENKCRLMATRKGWKPFQISTGQCFVNSCDWRKQSSFKLQEFLSLVKNPREALTTAGMVFNTI